MRPRWLLPLLLLPCLFALPATAAPAYQESKPVYSVVTEDARIRMGDGVELAATIGLPSKDGAKRAPGRFPVVVSLTPYGKDLTSPNAYLVTRGYAVAVVDIRGAGASGGDLSANYFSPREQRDGYETVEWLARQPWSTGKVGMFGGSYLGITQYLTATMQPPHLAAIVPDVALGDLYRDATYHGGTLSQFFGAQYLAVQGGPGLGSGLNRPDQYPGILETKLTQAQGKPIAFDYVAHNTDDTFYRERSPIHRASKIKVPVLIHDGWFDGFIRGASEMWRELSARKGVETRLWVDPTPHKGARSTQYNPSGYQAAALGDFSAARLEFFDRHLKGFRTPNRPRVHVFRMGDDRYLDGRSWPPAGVRYTRYFASAAGLTTKRPAASTGTYAVNPADGWTTTLSRHGNMAVSAYQPLDQSYERAAGLVWQTPALTKPVSICGPIAVDLSAASTATQTSWVVRVSDVDGAGAATFLSEGYLRASHRALDAGRSRPERPYHPHVKPTPITPGQVTAYAIEVWPTCIQFGAGHRIQVQLTSTDFPNHAPGTVRVDKDHPDRLEVVVDPPAVQTVQYGGPRPTSVLLPIQRG